MLFVKRNRNRQVITKRCSKSFKTNDEDKETRLKPIKSEPKMVTKKRSLVTNGNSMKNTYHSSVLS